MTDTASPDAPEASGQDGRDEATVGATCSSPPCMLGAEGEAPADAPRAEPGPDDAADIRLWRKAKRTVLLDRRIAMAEGSRAAHAERITAALTEILAPVGGEPVGFYWPFKREYDPRPIVRALHARGVPLALPVVVAKAQPLVFRPWHPGAPMALGVWNIPFPTEGDAVLPGTLLVPLLGFDPRGYRLGYGGGFYDRTVAAMPSRPRLIGIGFEIGRLPTIYPQPHDIRMDLIVTERGVERHGAAG